MNGCRHLITSFAACLFILLPEDVSAEWEGISAYNNSDQIFAQEMCESEGNRGQHHSALEWGRSGIFANAAFGFDGDFKTANRVLLNCIEQAKNAIMRSSASANTNFDLSTGRATLPQEKEQYLGKGKPKQLANAALALRSKGALEDAAIALAMALDRGQAPRVINRDNSNNYWKWADTDWLSAIRIQLAEIEFQLGAHDTAIKRVHRDIAIRGKNPRLPPNDLPAKALLGSSFVASGDYAKGRRLLSDVLERLKRQSAERMKLVWQERPANTSQQYYVQLSMLVRAHRDAYESSGQQDLPALNGAFFAAQFANLGSISDAYEDLAIRRQSHNFDLEVAKRTQQSRRETYDIEMNRVENDLQTALTTNVPVPASVYTGISALSRLRLLLHETESAISTESSADLQISDLPSSMLSIEYIQRRLSDDQAVLFYFEAPQIGDSKEELHIWAITKDAVTWTVNEVSTAGLASNITRLRCGLDINFARSEQCRVLTNSEHNGLDPQSGLPVFDLKLANQLYNLVIPNDISLILPRKLTIVPSSSLASLPFDATVESLEGLPDRTSQFKGLDIPWLIEKYSIAFTPSLTGVRDRGDRTLDGNRQEFLISFGVPLLRGEPDKYPRHLRSYKASVLSNWCKNTPKAETQVKFVFEETSNVVKLPSELALEKLAPLPETYDEICDFARLLNPRESKQYLADQAREVVVKSLNKTGELKRASIIHFATHALLASEIEGIDEPGIVLSPAVEGSSPQDDGFLSASEISNLTIGADLVVLSACNTGGGFARNGAALSGLARSFFLAGAKTLLVSHWASNSDASVEIVSATAQFAKEKRIGAGSLRLAKLAYIENHEAHPYFWSQFFLIGDGA